MSRPVVAADPGSRPVINLAAPAVPGQSSNKSDEDESHNGKPDDVNDEPHTSASFVAAYSGESERTLIFPAKLSYPNSTRVKGCRAASRRGKGMDIGKG
jgi:hypothetical protein